MKVTGRWLGLFNCYYIFFRVCVHTCHRLCLAVKEQLERNGSFLPLCGFWELNTGGCQGWWQVPFPVEQSYWLAIRARVSDCEWGIVPKKEAHFSYLLWTLIHKSAVCNTPTGLSEPNNGTLVLSFPASRAVTNKCHSSQNHMRQSNPEGGAWTQVCVFFGCLCFLVYNMSSSLITLQHQSSSYHMVVLLHIFSHFLGHYHVSLILLQPPNWSPHHEIFSLNYSLIYFP